MARKFSSIKGKERLRVLNLWLKSFSGIFLNSLLYFCTWLWIILPLFPTLPFIGYWVWFGLEILRGKIKKSEYIGVVDNSLEVVPGKESWSGFIIGYGFIFLILWLCSLSIPSSPASSFSLPTISLTVGG